MIAEELKIKLTNFNLLLQLKLFHFADSHKKTIYIGYIQKIIII